MQDSMAWIELLSEAVLGILTFFFTPAGGTGNQVFFPKKYDQSSELISPNSWMGEASCSERGSHLLSLYQFQVHCTATGPNLHKNVALATCPSPSGLLYHGITSSLQPGIVLGWKIPPSCWGVAPWQPMNIVPPAKLPSSLCKWHPAPLCSPNVCKPKDVHLPTRGNCFRMNAILVKVTRLWMAPYLNYILSNAGSATGDGTLL